MSVNLRGKLFILFLLATMALNGRSVAICMMPGESMAAADCCDEGCKSPAYGLEMRCMETIEFPAAIAKTGYSIEFVSTPVTSAEPYSVQIQRLFVPPILTAYSKPPPVSITILRI